MRRWHAWRSPAVLRFGWPLAALCIGMPLWFFLGIAPFVWSMPGLMFLLAMLARPERWKVPHGGAFLAGTVIWIGLSGIQVTGAQDLLLFTYRFTLFLSTFALFMFVSNAPARRLPTEAVCDWMSILFLVVIVLGALGIVLGGHTFESPLQMVLPPNIASSSFIDGVSRLRFAEVQGFLGYPVARPSAPFAFTNGWGSTVGLLAPYFFASWFRSGVPFRRRLAVPLALVALIPMVVSMNRGLWLSLSVGLMLVAARRAANGDWRLVRYLVIGVLAITVLTVATPLGDFVTGKLEGSAQSNESRGSIYVDAYEGALASPLLGHGVPGRRSNGPPIGSHGLLWWILYCHGFVALGLFVAWMFRVVWAGRRISSDLASWPYVSLLVLVIQFPIYGLLPQLPLAAVSAGLVHRQVYPPQDPLREVE